MTPPKEKKDAKADDDERRRRLNLMLPFGERQQQRERQQHQQDCKEMPSRQRPERQEQGARASFHESCGDRERPAHSGIDPVKDAARDHSKPEPRQSPIGSAQFQTDG